MVSVWRLFVNSHGAFMGFQLLRWYLVLSVTSWCDRAFAFREPHGVSVMLWWVFEATLWTPDVTMLCLWCCLAVVLS